MTFRELYKSAMHLISVPKCVACNDRLEYPTFTFCPKCSCEYEENKSRNCSLCAKPLYECSCSNDYLRAHFVKRLYKVFRYKQRKENLAANSLIYSLKRDNRSDVLEFCANELFAAVRHDSLPNDLIITNVPRRRGAIIKYGIDHSNLLARALAKRLDATYIPILASKSKREQKTLRGEDRVKNTNFYLRREPDLSGKTVIIVDDIVTTGSSMATSGMLVHSLGAKNIYGASLAIAYKEG